jgi:formylglycine-generating enzyme required for sulfatase activity
MKAFVRNLGIVACLFVSFSAAAQKKTYCPPGTVKFLPTETGVKHATFIDHSPITVIAWLEFLYWNEREYGKESAEYKAVLPDSLVCLQAYQGDWRYPGYRNYPMVGITYEQAVEYCKWRADRVNESLNLRKEKYTVSYSLPTEADLNVAYEQYKITYCYPSDPPVNELTAEKTVMIKGWRLSFEPYQEASAMIGFRCVAEIHK